MPALAAVSPNRETGPRTISSEFTKGYDTYPEQVQRRFLGNTFAYHHLGKAS